MYSIRSNTTSCLDNTIIAGTTGGIVLIVLIALLVLALMIRRRRQNGANLANTLINGVPLNPNTPEVSDDYLAMHDLETWEENNPDIDEAVVPEH